MSTAKPKQLRNLGGLCHAPVTEHQPGIYFLVEKGTVIYVGQSSMPRRRIADHLREGIKQFDDAWIRHCDEKELDTLESMFIHHLKPTHNFTTATNEKLAPLSFDSVKPHINALVDRLIAADKPSVSKIQYSDMPSTRTRLIRLPEVMHWVGLKKTSIYQHMEDGKFPRCVKFGRAVMWPEEKVRAWVEERMVSQTGIEPVSAP